MRLPWSHFLILYAIIAKYNNTDYGVSIEEIFIHASHVESDDTTVTIPYRRQHLRYFWTLLSPSMHGLVNTVENKYRNCWHYNVTIGGRAGSTVIFFVGNIRSKFFSSFILILRASHVVILGLKSLTRFAYYFICPH